jgi:hypothetical protein
MTTLNTKTLRAMLNTNGAMFANMLTTSDVAVAAKFKAEVKITKISRHNVVLFGKLREGTNPYLNKMVKTASEAVQKSEIEMATTYYTHDPECYSLATHKDKGTEYVWAMKNGASKSVFFINGKRASVEGVCQFLTPSAAKALREPSKTVVNVTNAIEHEAKCFVTKLSNVLRVKANNLTFTA